MNLFTLSESKRYPGLFVRKYSRRVFYYNLWTPELIESRGHVEDANGNVVIRPFTKIFNRFENDTDIDLEEQVLAVQKINGFMAALTYVPLYGKSIVSTTGSLDSSFVDMAYEMIPQEAFEMSNRMRDTPVSFLFEIVHPNDSHIISEVPGAYLIGRRVVADRRGYSSNLYQEKVSDILAHNIMNVMRPTWHYLPFKDVVEMARTATHEGYVVYSEDKSLKIKSPFYLVSKFLGRMSKDKLQKLSKNPEVFKRHVGEEFFPLVNAISDIKVEFGKWNDQERIAYIQNFLGAVSEIKEEQKFDEFFGA